LSGSGGMLMVSGARRRSTDVVAESQLPWLL
jgi:hypothetical protein